MKQKYTQTQFNSAKSNDKLPLECYGCSQTFYKEKKYITQLLKNNITYPNKYCSKNCEYNHKYTKTNLIVKCLNCNETFTKKLSQIKKRPNHFCSKSCSASYHNTHKTTGNRRSKLEKYVEEQLIKLYPNLDIHFNRKDAIGSELDIYIPMLNIAFELNGIFHYEPIYGVNKFSQIQLNDISKSKACHDAKIDLCILDTSGQSYFKESTSQKYLEMINNIIKERVLTI